MATDGRVGWRMQMSRLIPMQWTLVALMAGVTYREALRRALDEDELVEAA